MTIFIIGAGFTGMQLAATLLESNSATAFSATLRETCFQIASVVSTTGFMTADYTQWRPPSQVAILLLFFIGGCSGSTAGDRTVAKRL